MGNTSLPTITRRQSIADAVCEELALENHDLREANRQLVDLVADLSFDVAVLRMTCDTYYRLAAERGRKLIRSARGSEEAA